jgi:small conductance mechanosensitive channel
LRLAVRITAIPAAAWLAHRIAGRLVRWLRLVATARVSGPENAKRIETVGRTARYALAVVSLLVAGMRVLSELGVSIAPIVSAAGAPRAGRGGSVVASCGGGQARGQAG